MNATLGRKTSRPTPPDKGSFPLDHEGENNNRVLFILAGTLLFWYICYRRMQEVHETVHAVLEGKQR